VVSPFTPYGPTIALVFVLLVAAVKAAAEDRKRHAEDRRTNNSTAHVVQADGAPRTSCPCGPRTDGAQLLTFEGACQIFWKCGHSTRVEPRRVH